MSTRNLKNPQKCKIVYDYQVCWSNSFTEFNNDNEPLNTFFKPEHIVFDLRKIAFPSNKNMVVEFYYASDTTLKVAKQIYDLGVVGGFFFVVLRGQQKPI